MSDLNKLKEIAGNYDFSQFSATPINSDPDCSEWEYTNSEPCPDFRKLLPKKVLGKNGEEVQISQSWMKRFRKVIEGELCPKRFYAVNVAQTHEEPTTGPMYAGTRFEYLLTGQLGRDGDGEEPIKTPTGKIGAEEVRVKKNAQIAKNVLKYHGIDLEKVKTGVKLQYKCLGGISDIEQRGVRTIDIKYSGLLGKNATYSDLGWTESNVRYGYKAQIQARHYTLLRELRTGKRVPFEFFVFDNRKGHEGDVHIFRLEFSDERINEHKWFILKIIEEFDRWIREEPFQSIPSYSDCKNCPVSNCSDRVKRRDKVVIKI